MSEIIDDTGWQESEHGYSIRSYKIKNFKPFTMKDLENTWCISMPDGKGNVTNCGGHWIDGKMVEEWRETIKDPLDKLLNK